MGVEQQKFFWYVVAVIDAAILVYRGIWARMTTPGSFSFRQGYIVSFALYFLAGLLIGRTLGLRQGILGGVIVAGVEVTLGIALAYLLGAYDEPTKALLTHPSFVLLALTLQLLFGATLGALGGIAAQVLKRGQL
jgi:hypothetical protein